MYKKRSATPLFLRIFYSRIDYARSTAPERRHLVHTCILLAAPFTLHFTLFTLEFQIALDLLWEWLTLLPKWTPFPQISHFAIVSTSSTKLSHSTHNSSILSEKVTFGKFFLVKNIIFYKKYMFPFFQKTVIIITLMFYKEDFYERIYEYPHG